ncbi:acyl carrier protein [Amycolatopsis sulphurea]|uniref:acyl carrier protein n=1 Tax=Amycolatopsis sulphurea TaxID=76022 RepID=UPI000BF6CA84|nr:acyl carrier protein [Amycolatopsis sulphurea]
MVVSDAQAARPEVAPKLRTVFVDALDLDGEVDVENLKYREIEAWDSVGHMALVAAIEDEFDVEFDTDQVIDMSSFKVAVDMVTELTAKND